MNKFYYLYNNSEKDQIDISIRRYIIANNLKLKDIEGTVNHKVYEKLIKKKDLAREEDLELQKSMIRKICKTDDEEEFKRLLNNLALYLRNKVRPFLFMVGEKDKLRSETMVAISQIMVESKATSSPTPRTSEVLVSGHMMHIDLNNVIINIEDTNLLQSSEPPESHSKHLEDKLRQIEGEKRLLEEEKRKVEETKKKLLEDENKIKIEDGKKILIEEEMK